MSQMPTPELMKEIHLRIINSYEKNAVSIENLTQVLSDPLVGMRAILNYKQYNDELDTNLKSLYYVLN